MDAYQRSIEDRVEKIMKIFDMTCYAERCEVLYKVLTIVQKDFDDMKIRDDQIWAVNVDESEEFYKVFKTLSRRGRCDGVGGREYKRVRLQWEEAGKPTDIKAFIISHV